MKEQLKAVIEKAEKTILSARILHREKLYSSAGNRAYYAFFYCVQAFLMTENIIVKTHKGANVQFSKYFVKTGKVESRWAGIFKSLEDMRQEADYDFERDPDALEIRNAIKDASDFLKFTKSYFKNAL